MADLLVCPKCNTTMVEGFLPDSNQSMNFVNSWVEGLPEKSFLHVTKTEGKRQFRITTFRCGSCGYLEMYA